MQNKQTIRKQTKRKQTNSLQRFNEREPGRRGRAGEEISVMDGSNSLSARKQGLWVFHFGLVRKWSDWEKHLTTKSRIHCQYSSQTKHPLTIFLPLPHTTYFILLLYSCAPCCFELGSIIKRKGTMDGMAPHSSNVHFHVPNGSVNRKLQARNKKRKWGDEEGLRNMDY